MGQSGAIRSRQKVVQLFGGNPQTEKPMEIQEVSSFAHLLTFLTRTQVLRKGCFTPSRVSTMMPISFHPLPLQLFNGRCHVLDPVLCQNSALLK